MAVRSIVSVDVQTGSFREFQRLYDRYDRALKSAPAAWKIVQSNIDGSRASFTKLVGQMTAAKVQSDLRAKAQERADRLTQTSAERWAQMARSSREFLRNVVGSTVQLLKWGSITGVISGLVGAGGIWGIDRLATGVMGRQRGALGVGTTIGGAAAFGTNLQQFLGDPAGFLASISSAKTDINQQTGLRSLGLTTGQIRGDTTQAAVAALRGLKREADAWDPTLFQNMLNATRQSGFASPELLNVLRASSPAQFEKMIAQVGQRRPGFELGSDVTQRWNDFAVQISNAGKAIETTLVRGLVGLAPGLTRMSEAIEKTFSVLLRRGGPVERWIGKLGDALERFAKYVGTDEFQQNVEQFVVNVGKLGKAIGTALSWIGGSDPGVAAHRARQSDAVAKLRRDRAEGKATAWSQFKDIFSGNTPMSFDDLVSLVKKREGSGARAVSPKGALGRFQIEPGTARQYGFDPGRLLDERYNEQAARAILADLARRYHGNVSEILAAYNAGPGRANAYRSAGDDPRTLPAETRKYIAGTDKMTVRIENNTGGSAAVTVNGLKQ